jgi:hypothetical protein
LLAGIVMIDPHARHRQPQPGQPCLFATFYWRFIGDARVVIPFGTRPPDTTGWPTTILEREQ